MLRLLLMSSYNQRRTNLFALTAYLRALLSPLLRRTPAHILHLPPTASSSSPSPILGLLTPTPHALSAFLLERGFIIRPVMPPTVPPGGERVRICLRAGMEKEVLDRLVEALRMWVEIKMRQEVAVRSQGGGRALEMVLKAKL